MRTGKLSLALVALLSLSACAYKPLKAPCAPDEGETLLAYTHPPSMPALPTEFQMVDRCGPMKPV